MTISVIDYGVGNIGSICNMINKAGGNTEIITSPESLNKASVLILPGVGSFDNAMKELENNLWVEPLYQRVIVDKIPILGVCLGMQLFTRQSQEGVRKGLGYINADTKLFSVDKLPGYFSVPHMGWNLVEVMKDNVLFSPDFDEQRFYFIHSYHVVCDDEEDVLTKTNYGYEFVSSFQKDNIIGVQFHPEKSHKFGFEFFKRFVSYYEK